jgi:hypothetical protein
MDATSLDTLARTLGNGASRRMVLGGVLAAFGLLNAGSVARKKKRKPLKRNQFGCVNVGAKCRGNDANCCSGICEGEKPKKRKKDRSRCAGHDARTCQAGQDTCAGPFFPCVSSRSATARCVITTGNAPYCAGDVFCRSCARDTDCSAEEFETGAACIVCASCPETTACATLRTFA